MEIDRNGLEVLERGECLRLLATATLGRVGISLAALPTVLPVNFWLDGERILVRTGPGSKLDAAMHNAVVAFEVDDIDPMYHSGWSVVVTGIAHEIIDQGELDRLRSVPLARWAPRGGDHVLAIGTEMVTGRRVGSAPRRREEL